MSVRHRRRVLRELSQNPAWKIGVGAAWLCPYCGDAVVREARPDESPEEASAERALEHFAVCPTWREFEGRLLPPAELEARAQLLRAREGIRRALVSNPSWQLYDVARRWHCPFCAEPTAVKVPEGGRISSSTLKEIERHLAGCAGYDRGRGEEKPLGHLKSMIAFANRTQKMAEQIRRKIETDAQWRLRTAESRWVCPYCRRAIDAIDFSTSHQMTEVAPLEIAKHLVSSCEQFLGAQKKHLETQSSASLEIARLGSAPNTEIVRLSGLPPAAVSGEYGAVGAGAGAGAATVAREEPTRQPGEPRNTPAGTGRSAGPPASFGTHLSKQPPARAPADPRAWRDAIDTRLSEVRSQVPGAAARPLEAPPPLPEVEGLEIRTFFRGARAYPSDFVDVTALDARRVAIAIGAVAGDGAEEGVVLPIVRNLFRLHGRSGLAPADVLRHVNADLFSELDGKTYVSACYGVLDIALPAYRFARAGTDCPLRFRPGREGTLDELASGGMVLGVDRGPTFEASLAERETPLEPGDLIVQFTHGAVSAEDVDGRELSAERFRDLVRKYGRHEADYFIFKFGQVFEDWTRGAPLADDACVLAVKLKER